MERQSKGIVTILWVKIIPSYNITQNITINYLHGNKQLRKVILFSLFGIFNCLTKWRHKHSKAPIALLFKVPQAKSDACFTTNNVVQASIYLQERFITLNNPKNGRANKIQNKQGKRIHERIKNNQMALGSSEFKKFNGARALVRAASPWENVALNMGAGGF